MAIKAKKTNHNRRYAIGSGGHKTHPQNLLARREGVLERLEAQVKRGSGGVYANNPQMSRDVKHIQADILKLKAKWKL